jgi:hypothetical protein
MRDAMPCMGSVLRSGAAAITLLLAACANQGTAPASGTSALPSGGPRSGGVAPAAPPGQAAAQTPGSAQGPAPVEPQSIAAEQRWLRALFNGTPVTVEDEWSGALRVEVPLVHSFDDNSAMPKRPLKAVLDKVSQSLLRQLPMQVQVGTPGPAAKERFAALRKHLNANGVAMPRIVAIADEPAGTVLLRIAAPAAEEPRGGGLTPGLVRAKRAP